MQENIRLGLGLLYFWDIVYIIVDVLVLLLTEVLSLINTADRLHYITGSLYNMNININNWSQVPCFSEGSATWRIACLWRLSDVSPAAVLICKHIQSSMSFTQRRCGFSFWWWWLLKIVKGKGKGNVDLYSMACDDLCHDMPCWFWFVHWLSARWTTATRFSLVSPASCKTGCSPSWMPPPVWFSQRGGQNAKPHCFVNSIGWEFRSESHSGCPFWPTAVFMEQDI